MFEWATIYSHCKRIKGRILGENHPCTMPGGYHCSNLGLVPSKDASWTPFSPLGGLEIFGATKVERKNFLRCKETGRFR